MSRGRAGSKFQLGGKHEQKKIRFRVYRKQPTGLRHGNMDLFTRGSTKRKRKNRVRGK